MEALPRDRRRPAERKAGDGGGTAGGGGGGGGASSSVAAISGMISSITSGGASICTSSAYAIHVPLSPKRAEMAKRMGWRPRAKSWAPRQHPCLVPVRDWITSGGRPSRLTYSSEGMPYIVQTQSQRPGKRRATTSRKARRCMELKALETSRATSTQPGCSSKRQRTEWVTNSRPELQATPTWAGHGEPSGWVGGRVVQPGGGGWRKEANRD